MLVSRKCLRQSSYSPSANFIADRTTDKLHSMRFAEEDCKEIGARDVSTP